MKTILVIDDNKQIRENISEILTFSGYIVIEAENGITGIDIAQQEIPDLIICDVMMPEIDGYTVITELNKHPTTAEIPFIFLTAKADTCDRYLGLHLGADDYLHKPFDEDILLVTIQNKIYKKESVKSKIENEHLLFIKTLEYIQFMTSHNIRGSLCSFLGLMNVLEQNNAPMAAELKKILEYAGTSATDMDKFTRELTAFTHRELTEYKNKLKFRD